MRDAAAAGLDRVRASARCASHTGADGNAIAHAIAHAIAYAVAHTIAYTHACPIDHLRAERETKVS